MCATNCIIMFLIDFQGFGSQNDVPPVLLVQEHKRQRHFRYTRKADEYLEESISYCFHYSPCRLASCLGLWHLGSNLDGLLNTVRLG